MICGIIYSLYGKHISQPMGDWTFIGNYTDAVKLAEAAHRLGTQNYKIKIHRNGEIEFEGDF